MSEHKYKHYIAYAEQAAQGASEKSTVGFLPVKDFQQPGLEPTDEEREEFLGDERVLGVTDVERMGSKWSLSPEMPFFAEAGSSKNLPAIICKHLGGGSANSQNASTGQYYNTIYPVSDPRAAANLDTKMLTFNSNFSHGDDVRNHPHADALVKAITFTQVKEKELMWTVEHEGGFIETNEAEIGSPVFPASNLRLKYNHLKAYSGTISTIGTAPVFTGFTFGSADQFKPQDLTLKLMCDRALDYQFEGLDYPTNIIDGEHTAELEFTVNFNNPASGFNSIDEFTAWLADVSTVQSFCFWWDSGVTAGSGNNYGMYVYLPEMYRQGPEITWDPRKAPVVKLKYKGKYNTTAKAQWVALIENTADAI